MQMKSPQPPDARCALRESAKTVSGKLRRSWRGLFWVQPKRLVGQAGYIPVLAVNGPGVSLRLQADA